MTHLTDEAILSVRDQEPVAGEALAHLQNCAACARALEEARARSRSVERALAVLSAPPVAASPRTAPRRFPSSDVPPGRSARTRPASPALRWLRRAAVVLLVGTGAASALPGPFSGWIPRLFQEASAPAVTPDVVSGAGAPEAEPVGGRLAVADGPVTVRLQGVPSGALIQVRQVSPRALGVYAGPGSEFAYGRSEVRASIAGGPVRVELPEGVVPVSLYVNRDLYLVVDAQGMEVSGPVVPDTESLVTFRVPN